MATIEDFKKVELRLGKVIEVTMHPNADKLYLVKVDIGTETRQIVAGIKDFYPDSAALVGRYVVVAANLEPKMLRGAESQGMILAVRDASNLCTLTIDRDIQLGTIVT